MPGGGPGGLGPGSCGGRMSGGDGGLNPGGRTPTDGGRYPGCRSYPRHGLGRQAGTGAGSGRQPVTGGGGGRPPHQRGWLYHGRSR